MKKSKIIIPDMIVCDMTNVNRRLMVCPGGNKDENYPVGDEAIITPKSITDVDEGHMLYPNKAIAFNPADPKGYIPNNLSTTSMTMQIDENHRVFTKEEREEYNRLKALSCGFVKSMKLLGLG